MERDKTVLGEGSSLTFPQLKDRIKQETDIILHKDDPVLAVAVMLQVGIEENEKLLQRHEKAVAETMELNVNSLVAQMGELTHEFSNSALNESLREKIAGLAEYKSITDSMNTDLRGYLRSIKIFTTINVFLFVAIAALATSVAT